jgi:hypothetical protein
MCRGALPSLPCRGESKKKGGRTLGFTTGYPHAYQQADETTVQTPTQEAMEGDALASAAGNGGAKRKTEERNVGVKDSQSTRAKTAASPSNRAYAWGH